MLQIVSLFLASMKETLYVFRDAVDDFLRRLGGMLRVAVDQEALQGGSSFPVCFHQNL